MDDTTTPSSVRRELNQKFDALPIFKRDRTSALYHFCVAVEMSTYPYTIDRVFSASLRARVVVADLLRDYAKWRTGEDRRLTSSSRKFWESRCRRPQSPVPAFIIDENPVGRGAIGEPNGIFRD